MNGTPQLWGRRRGDEPGGGLCTRNPISHLMWCVDEPPGPLSCDQNELVCKGPRGVADESDQHDGSMRSDRNIELKTKSTGRKSPMEPRSEGGVVDTNPLHNAAPSHSSSS